MFLLWSNRALLLTNLRSLLSVVVYLLILFLEKLTMVFCVFRYSVVEILLLFILSLIVFPLYVIGMNCFDLGEYDVKTYAFHCVCFSLCFSSIPLELIECFPGFSFSKESFHVPSY